MRETGDADHAGVLLGITGVSGVTIRLEHAVEAVQQRGDLSVLARQSPVEDDIVVRATDRPEVTLEGLALGFIGILAADGVSSACRYRPLSNRSFIFR